MSMERHKCKLCSKNFTNGRALGGHMRSHLLPLPPSKRTRQQQRLTVSDSSSSNSQQQQQQQQEEEVVKVVAEHVLGVTSYGLRENPKKSVKASDPEFLDAGSSVINLHDQEDRLSEIDESTENHPTRKQRSKRTQSQAKEAAQDQVVEAKLMGTDDGVPITSTESVTESIPAVSSVSDVTSTQDEEVALCLMMLSKDKWAKEDKSVLVLLDMNNTTTNESSELSLKEAAAATDNNNNTKKPSRAKYKCLVCRKNFRSEKALSGHTATSRMCQEEENAGVYDEDQKIYECPFCFKVFGSGQALGGHKRSHLLGGTTTVIAKAATISARVPPAAAADRDSSPSQIIVDHNKVVNCFIDLNLPAPVEDDGDF